MTIEEELKARETAAQNARYKKEAEFMQKAMEEEIKRAWEKQGGSYYAPELVMPTGSLKEIVDEIIPVVFYGDLPICDASLVENGFAKEYRNFAGYEYLNNSCEKGYFYLGKVKEGNRIVTRPIKKSNEMKVRYFTCGSYDHRDGRVFILENGLVGCGNTPLKPFSTSARWLYDYHDSTRGFVNNFEKYKEDFRKQLLDTISKRRRQLEAYKKPRKRRKGCYIATSVYGSYDCPQVWALRRYRDNYLAQSVLGRVFIRCYYTISPTLVKLFGKKKWFQTIWKGFLDKKVCLLKKHGYEDTPYDDLNW